MRVALSGHDLGQRLAFSNQGHLVTAYQRFRRQGPRIVIGGHDKSVGARAHHREQIAGAQFRHFSILGKKIATLTNWSNDVDLLPLNRILKPTPTGFRAIR